ncbi:MAG: DUF6272 family protein [Kofleriaceae bacterium]
MSFAPNVKLISTVRRFTEEFYDRVLQDHDISEKVALATHELLENAVAYASDGETGVRVELADDRLTVKTWNRVSPERLAALKTVIDEMNRATDPDDYYQILMNKTAYRTDGSGLGLARIRAEAEMAISYEVITDQVCIQAQTMVKPKQVLP